MALSGSSIVTWHLAQPQGIQGPTVFGCGRRQDRFRDETIRGRLFASRWRERNALKQVRWRCQAIQSKSLDVKRFVRARHYPAFQWASGHWYMHTHQAKRWRKILGGWDLLKFWDCRIRIAHIFRSCRRLRSRSAVYGLLLELLLLLFYITRSTVNSSVTIVKESRKRIDQNQTRNCRVLAAPKCKIVLRNFSYTLSVSNHGD